MVKWDLCLDGDLMEVLSDLVKDLGERCVLGRFGVKWECLELKGHGRGARKRAEGRYL